MADAVSEDHAPVLHTTEHGGRAGDREPVINVILLLDTGLGASQESDNGG